MKILKTPAIILLFLAICFNGYADNTVNVYNVTELKYWQKQIPLANLFASAIKNNETDKALNLITENKFEFKKMPFKWKRACSFYAFINLNRQYFNYMF